MLSEKTIAKYEIRYAEIPFFAKTQYFINIDETSLILPFYKGFVAKKSIWEAKD